VWHASAGGGPPLLAAGLVWTIGQDGVVYGLNPATGSVQAQATVGTPANHFPTPSVGAGLLLVPSARDVVAFAAPAAGTASTTTSAPVTTTTAARHATAAPASSAGGSPALWIALAVVAALLLGAGVGLAVRATRRRPAP